MKKEKRRPGRPPKAPGTHRDIPKKLYISEDLYRRYAELYMQSEAGSESEFLAELVRLGMQVKRRQLAATLNILEETP